MIKELDSQLNKCSNLEQICATLNNNKRVILINNIDQINKLYPKIIEQYIPELVSFIDNSNLVFDINHKDDYHFEEKRGQARLNAKLTFSSELKLDKNLAVHFSIVDSLKSLTAFQIGVGGNNLSSGSYDISFVYSQNKHLFIYECIERTKKYLSQKSDVFSNIKTSTQIKLLNSFYDDLLYKEEFSDLKNAYFDLIYQCKDIKDRFIRKEIKNANIIIECFNMNKSLGIRETPYKVNKFKI